jgi:hypothetical protein
LEGCGSQRDSSGYSVIRDPQQLLKQQCLTAKQRSVPSPYRRTERTTTSSTRRRRSDQPLFGTSRRTRSSAGIGR